MHTVAAEVLPAVDHAFRPGISLERLRCQAPAAFADRPFGAVSPSYRFISTRDLVAALLEAGLVATDARQTRARGERAGYSRHMLRFRPLRTEVALDEAIPEIAVLNAHDGTSAYQVRAALFRPVCTNGLLAKLGDVGMIYVPHRGNVVANIVDAAQRILADFDGVAHSVRAMTRTALTGPAQRAFAREASLLRWEAPDRVAPDALLERRRPADAGDDLWTVYNVVQENLIRGGVRYRSDSGRQIRSRGIGAIREDVRINTRLWQAAIARIVA
jgi:hypothetical protein